MPSQTIQALVRIATIQSTITVPGLPIPLILQAEPFQPSNVTSIIAPFFVNELALNGGPARLPISAGMQYITTMIEMMLAVQRKEAGIDLKYNIQNTLQWRDAVFAMFATHVKLSYPLINILSSTNTNPIQVTMPVQHGLVTGDQVTIAGHLVNTNANGAWTVTVINEWTFSIPAAGNGVGGNTGTERKIQPVDLPYVTATEVTGWELVDYEYGDSEWLAIRFPLRLDEMYPTPISG